LRPPGLIGPPSPEFLPFPQARGPFLSAGGALGEPIRARGKNNFQKKSLHDTFCYGKDGIVHAAGG
jgi:hypothetical protein